MAVAYLEAAAHSGNEAWRERAREMLEELLATKYKVGVGWEHTEGVEGQLADQAWGLWASLKAYQGGLGEQWWTAAQAMVTQIEGHYADGEHGGYFDIAHEGVGRLRERMKPLGENALMAMALREMDVLSDGEGGYRVRARRILESVAGVVAQSGVMASGFARALDRLESDLKVTTGNWELAAAAIRAHPYVVIDPRGDERALICVGKTCLSPVTSAAEVTKAVREATNKPKIAGQVVSIA
jgi:uncharacterized protein YyaL (SSP411 family)